MNKVKIKSEAKAILYIVLTVLLIKVTVVEAYIVPTGSMENTIMTGDFLIGSRFVFGMRTPDWLGIPYTDKGFFIPYYKFPAFRIPKKGDAVDINPKNAQLLLHLMLLDGHRVTLQNSLQNYEFTMTSPDELWRRKGKPKVYEPYYPQGKLLVPWSTNNLPSGMIMVDGVPITEMKSYIVEQNYYWAMGDNRDDSLDSRFWGFVPESHILGEALLAYFSLDISSFPYIPRFGRIGTIIQ